MQRFLGLILAIAGTAGVAMAGEPAVPEITPASAVGALTMLSGSMLVLRARLKK